MGMFYLMDKRALLSLYSASVTVARAVGLIYSLSRSAVTLGLELIQKRMERNQRVDSGGGRRPQEHRSIGRTRTSVSRAQVSQGKEASTLDVGGVKAALAAVLCLPATLL